MQKWTLFHRKALHNLLKELHDSHILGAT